jgi:hypothetical protein
MWEYTNDHGWKPIEDFIEAAKAKDSERKWEECGFNSYADFAYGDRETLRMTVMRRRRTGPVLKPAPSPDEPPVPPPIEAKPANLDYNFIVVIQFGGALDKIALKTLPDLLKLLADIGPLAENAKTTLKPGMSHHG